MKQHITAKQWGEIERKKQKVFEAEVGCEFYEGNEYKNEPDRLPSIGQMIDFLGKGWFDKIDTYRPDQLCDALWQACLEVRLVSLNE